MKTQQKTILITLILSLLINNAFILGVFEYAPHIFTQQEQQPHSTEIVREVVEVKNDYDDQVISVVENAKDAVVSVVILQKRSTQVLNNETPINDFFFGLPFDQENILPVEDEQSPEEDKDRLQKVGGGTGFFIREDGLILTNKHVVDVEEGEFMIVTNDGREFSAELKETDPFFDLAIIQIIDADDELFPVIQLGNSDDIKVGQTVLAIGNALAEFSGSVTKGIVSGVARNTVASNGVGSTERLNNVIQVDVAINPGNSGGPLLTLDGKVVGINTAVARAENVGFSIPINDAKKAVDSFLEFGKIMRPKLGVRYMMITENIREKNGISYTYGALVVRGKSAAELAVIPGGPADKAGIEENDIILEIDGKKVDEQHPLVTHIQNFQINDTITIKLSHDGEEKEVQVILDVMDNE
jgi:serine protease Do